MNPGDEVVLTGLGALTAAGPGLEAAARALAGSKAPLSPVDRELGGHLPKGARTMARIGCEVPEPWLTPATARRMSRPSRFAVAAARMALAQAGLDADAADSSGGPTGVWLATVLGACDFTERLLRQILSDGPLAASPVHFTESVANAAAAQVAIACRAAGPNVTVVEREAGVAIALAQAERGLRSGQAGRALAGVVDEVTPLVHAILDRFRALARAGESCDDGHRGDEVARPFDRRRSGVLAADGAVVAVLEPAAEARRRGAPAMARVWGLGGAFDPGAPELGWTDDPTVLAEALTRILERAGLGPGDVDCIVSCASGSRGGDRLEGLVLRRVWGGSPLPPILAPRAVLGDFGGAQLAAAVLALTGAEFGPTPGFAEPDPELGIVPHAGGPLPPVDRVLVSTVAQGGAAAWALLERCRP